MAAEVMMLGALSLSVDYTCHRLSGMLNQYLDYPYDYADYMR
jgi:hypothetical protein